MHTINKNKIIAVTKIISPEKELVCFEKNSLGKNMPCEKTIISKNHCIVYKNRLEPAKNLINKVKNVYAIPYNNKPLYNILLEKHSYMFVNGIIAETLHPENIIAKIYMNKYTKEEKDEIIKNNNSYLFFKYNFLLQNLK